MSMGDPGLFPDTSWSLVSRLCATGQERYREGLDDLCRRYWNPAFAYVRAAWAKSGEEAKDLTQAFFLWLIEDEALRSYLPERGGFRPFLKTLLRRFVGHQAVALDRLKRGGGRTILPLDGRDLPAADETDPEKAFERAWLTEVVDAALRRVRARREEKGDVLSFRLYDAADLAPAAPSYAELAERHGVREGEVRDRLYALREEIRSEVRRELARLTSDDQDLEHEWRSFLGA
ncbi:MAG TPA: sigma-70 family RNA polymerase sigma factor [Planctomycetota bacterium]